MCKIYDFPNKKKWPCQMWILLFRPLSHFTFHARPNTKTSDKTRAVEGGHKDWFKCIISWQGKRTVVFPVRLYYSLRALHPSLALMHDDKLSVVLSLSLSRSLKERYDRISRSMRLHTNRPSMMLSFFYLLSIHHFVLIALSFDSTASHLLTHHNHE